jgi:NADP-dependent 3-hydroxy acid dehydrogenase YdfG
MSNSEGNLNGAVAVITGAASGMGLALAHRFSEAGCRVALADIEESALASAAADLQAGAGEALTVTTDVSDAASMDALRSAVLDRFDRVDLLFLNAGVGGGGAIETLTTADWEWVLGVNLWGVIHGLRVFLPDMIERDSGYIVNTASIAGHTSYSRMAPYNASKHAVVTISETLHAELHQSGSRVGVSVLCPGVVNTNIVDSDRNRPEHLQDPLIDEAKAAAGEFIRSATREAYSQALDPAAVANMVHDAIGRRQFYIWTDDLFTGAIARRHTDIQTGRNPTNMGNVLSPEEPIQ